METGLLLLCIVVWSLIGYAVALAVYRSTLDHSGEIISVETRIYSDKAYTNQITTLSWGQINNGSTYNKVVYVKNVGNKAVTLSLAIVNLPTFLTLIWNYTGAQIQPATAAPVQFTLTALPNATGTFAFQTRIASTEA